MSATNIALLVVAVVIFLTAASVSRIYVNDGKLYLVVIAMALYVVGNLLMIQIMRGGAGLGVAVSLAAIAQLVVINVIAFVFFHERPAPLQVAGMALGAVSLAMILFPGGER